MIDRIEALLQEAVDRQAVPGAVAVIAGPEGVRGLASAGAPAGPDTMFRLMSMTKALASVAALQLLEQGRIALDQQVASALPRFAELQVLDGFDGDTPRLRPPASAATIGQLLNHTSGLAYPFASRDLLRYAEVTGSPDPLSGRYAGIELPLLCDPGTAWNYGTSTDWLGLVVEAVSGQDLGAYLAEHVLGPLGMVDTTFVPDDEQRARLMAVHHRTPGGALVAGDLQLPTAVDFAAGGHACYGTAGDYGRFLAAILGGGALDGARILQPETVDLALSDHLGGLPLPEVKESVMPEYTNDVPSLPFRQGWGLGFHLFLEDIPGMRRAGSGDWVGLMNCYYWIDRSSQVAGALLTQVLPFFDGPIVELAAGLEQAVYSELGATAVPA